MNTPTAEQKRALIVIVSAITETIKEAGELGAPGGVLYAALMSQGCTLNQFESIIGALVRLGRITKDGDCYHFVGAR